MFSKEEMLPEQERQQVEERLKLLNSGLSLPESLSAESLHQKLTEQDLRSFREAGHPDFMYWRRYAGAVASFILVLVGMVVFTNVDLNLGNFVTGRSNVAVMDTEEGVYDYAAAPMETTESAVEESAPAPAPEAVAEEEKEAVRSRLYTSSYDEIAAALSAAKPKKAAAGMPAAPAEVLNQGQDSGSAILNEEESDDINLLPTPAGPQVDWQKDFTDLPGEMPDILKSDGTYFYYYSAPVYRGREGRVYIVEAESLTEVASIAVGPCEGTELLIRDGRLIIISHGLEQGGELLYEGEVLASADGLLSDKRPENDRAQQYGLTAVSIYDLSDLEEPRLTYSFIQDGSYSTGRLIGSRFCLISTKTVEDAGVDAALCDLVPVVWDNNSGSSRALDAAEVAVLPNSAGRTYTTVSLLDVGEGRAVATHGILGAESCYYADGSVYFCYGAEEEGTPAVGISRMSIGLQDLQLSGSVSLRGSVEYPTAVNRFEDTLRVATVTRDASSGLYRANVYTLDDAFHIIGSVEGLGTGEQVTDIRFIREMAYITSSRESRPVLALSLADPADPVAYGQIELESLPKTYRMFQDGQLMGLTPTPEGGLQAASFALKEGLLKTQSSHQLPGDTAYSAALQDYRAMLCSSNDGVLAFPVVCRQEMSFGSRPIEWGYAVYGWGDEGLEERGILTHADMLSENVARQRRDINRGRIIGGKLYTFSGSMIKAYRLDTLEEAAELRLT